MCRLLLISVCLFIHLTLSSQVNSTAGNINSNTTETPMKKNIRRSPAKSRSGISTSKTYLKSKLLENLNRYSEGADELELLDGANKKITKDEKIPEQDILMSNSILPTSDVRRERNSITNNIQMFDKIGIRPGKPVEVSPSAIRNEIEGEAAMFSGDYSHRDLLLPQRQSPAPPLRILPKKSRFLGKSKEKRYLQGSTNSTRIEVSERMAATIRDWRKKLYKAYKIDQKDERTRKEARSEEFHRPTSSDEKRQLVRMLGIDAGAKAEAAQSGFLPQIPSNTFSRYSTSANQRVGYIPAPRLDENPQYLLSTNEQPVMVQYHKPPPQTRLYFVTASAGPTFSATSPIPLLQEYSPGFGGNSNPNSNPGNNVVRPYPPDPQYQWKPHPSVSQLPSLNEWTFSSQGQGAGQGSPSQSIMGSPSQSIMGAASNNQVLLPMPTMPPLFTSTMPPLFSMNPTFTFDPTKYSMTKTTMSPPMIKTIPSIGPGGFGRTREFVYDDMDNNIDNPANFDMKTINEKRPGESDEKCNSLRLRTIIQNNIILNDAEGSKRAVQEAAEKETGRFVDVICGTGFFSYIAHTDEFCLASTGGVNCYAFSPVCGDVEEEDEEAENEEMRKRKRKAFLSRN